MTFDRITICKRITQMQEAFFLFAYFLLFTSLDINLPTVFQTQGIMWGRLSKVFSVCY